ncbi:MAG: penicillin-binding protein 2 [Gammaproteobacteria bacterium]|nr:penicillin-binding protein 2 [Gammaproteobacteria bacterium]
MTTSNYNIVRPYRYYFVVVSLLASMLFLAWRAIELQVLTKDFLREEGDARYLRDVSVPAHRGMITDRYGEPLAISTPINSVWVDPQIFQADYEQQIQLASKLNIKREKIRGILSERKKGREFAYLKRHVNPEIAQQVMALGMQGVFLQQEYHRYYPKGEVTGHLIGFTDYDDNGQEGLELAYDDWLKGINGKKRVLKDRLGRMVENVESLKDSNPGKTLALSIDRRIQYLAYRELKAAVKRHGARAGSLVMLDVQSGEVLAMVNQPANNPNNRSELKDSNYRNRSVTDVIEPGSTIKPFIIAAALESNRFSSGTIVDTSPGLLRVGSNIVKDSKNFGRIDLTTIIQKSSNVGATKVALKLEPEKIWDVLSRVSFGYRSGSGFPGESSGLLTHFSSWQKIETATLAFGYGLSVTPLQLARAYSALAGDGYLRPVSFLKIEGESQTSADQVFRPETTQKVRAMLEKVVLKGGTGTQAQVWGYRVAGKTGTVKKSGIGGYADKYVALFAGVAPASDPRIAMVVIVDEPTSEEYYGGQVAAPVFSKVASGALRLLNVAPDNISSEGIKTGAKIAKLGETP